MGSAMLSLAEAYGVLDEELLWKDPGIDIPSDRRRTLGEALQLAVRCAITSQENNPWKAWRYRPESKDADTSVTGAVLIGLLAARNAGVKVPDSNIDDAMQYIREVTTKRGEASYTPGFGLGTGSNMSAIACLVLAIESIKIGRNMQPSPTSSSRMRMSSTRLSRIQHVLHVAGTVSIGFRYLEQVESTCDASIETRSKTGREFLLFTRAAYGTSMSVLALALNYRFLPIYER